MTTLKIPTVRRPRIGQVEGRDCDALEKDCLVRQLRYCRGTDASMRSLDYDWLATLGTAAVTCVVFPCMLQARQPRPSRQHF